MQRATYNQQVCQYNIDSKLCYLDPIPTMASGRGHWHVLLEATAVAARYRLNSDNDHIDPALQTSAALLSVERIDLILYQCSTL